MTKHILFGSTALLLAFLAFSCKNNTPENAKTPEMTYPFEKPDSIFGLKGCEMAGFIATSKTDREFVYQNFKIKVKDNENTPGENIGIGPDSNGLVLRLPISEEGNFFQGATRNHFFVDQGTGPDIRKMLIFNIKPDAILQVYQAEYLAAEPPFVSSNGGFWFFMPIEESELLQVPDCPEKEKWVKDGLRVGYGQRCIYNMVTRMLTRKSEYICVPLQ
jgi:hypothetical protein